MRARVCLVRVCGNMRIHECEIVYAENLESHQPLQIWEIIFHKLYRSFVDLSEQFWDSFARESRHPSSLDVSVKSNAQRRDYRLTVKTAEVQRFCCALYVGSQNLLVGVRKCEEREAWKMQDIHEASHVVRTKCKLSCFEKKSYNMISCMKRETID